MAHELIQPPDLHATVGYTHASRVGNLVFVAGQVALDAQSEVVGEGDLEAQAHQTYRNLARVLEAAGGSLGLPKLPCGSMRTWRSEKSWPIRTSAS